MTTWLDLKKAALHDVVINRCVHLVEHENVLREEALINACITLAEIRRTLGEEVARLLAERPAQKQCGRGHTKRNIGCVSCVLVFDNTGCE